MDEKKNSPSKQTEYKIASIGGIVIIFLFILVGALSPLLGILGSIFGLWLTTLNRTYKEKSQGYTVTPLYKRPLLLVSIALLVFWHIISISAYNDVQKNKAAQTTQHTQLVDSAPSPAAAPAESQQPEQSASEPQLEKQPIKEEKVSEIKEQPAEAENNPLLEAEFLTADVKNGTKDQVIGKRGYIKIKKSDLKNITNEQFTAFANEKVANSGLNWVSIICEDGTGISFAGSISYVADYGTLDIEGCITKQVGVIMLEGDSYTYEEV